MNGLGLGRAEMRYVKKTMLSCTDKPCGQKSQTLINTWVHLNILSTYVRVFTTNYSPRPGLDVSDGA